MSLREAANFNIAALVLNAFHDKSRVSRVQQERLRAMTAAPAPLSLLNDLGVSDCRSKPVLTTV